MKQYFVADSLYNVSVWCNKMQIPMLVLQTGEENVIF